MSGKSELTNNGFHILSSLQRKGRLSAKKFAECRIKTAVEWPIKKFAEHHIKDGGLDSFVCSTIYYLVPHVTMAGNLLTQKGWKHSLLKLSLFSCRLQKCFLPNVTGGLAQVWLNYLLYPPFQYFDNTWHFANCFPMVNLKIVWFNYIWKYIKHKQYLPPTIVSWKYHSRLGVETYAFNIKR